jgi:general secretion pathway protein E
VAPWRSKPPQQIYKPVGCLECRRTGYMGRTGLVELMQISEAIQDLIAAGADLIKLRSQAAREGMRSLRISGAEKIAAGITTPAEVLQAAPPFGTEL